MRRCLAAVVAVVMFLSLGYGAQANDAWIDRSVVHMKTEEHVVALTFDDGPHPRYTARILDILAREEVRATFFMVGINVERYPDAARAVADAGHEIGNHTMHHMILTGKSAETVRDEAEACAGRILDVTGITPTLFRAPGGARGETLYTVLDGMGYRQILWNIDTRDWQGRGSGEITRAVLNTVHGGDIILCHDYVSGKLRIDAALARLIPALKARGYRFVTVGELLNYGEVVAPHF